MNIFDHQYHVYLLACNGAQPPFYRTEAREHLANTIGILQAQAMAAGELTVDVYHLTTNKVERAQDLKMERVSDELWNIIPFTFDQNNLLSRLYITVPPFEDSTASKIPSACILRIIYQHQSATSNFIVMLAISTGIKAKMGDQFQSVVDSMVQLFSPMAMLYKQRPFSEKGEFGYTNALIDFNTPQVLDGQGKVIEAFFDWQRII